MSVLLRLLAVAWPILSAAAVEQPPAAGSFSIASYNLENYCDRPTGTRPVKSEVSKSKIREALVKLDADILAVQEMGSLEALEELRTSLRTEGLDYPHWEFVNGVDTNIHVAILSRFPITARRAHTNDGFLLNGRRFRISRGIAEVDIRVSRDYRLTLLAAHLKSRREVPEADQAELRKQEAVLLRRFVDERLDADPDTHLAVVGDFNDVRNSSPIKILLGRGTHTLFDTRPTERSGDSANNLNPRLPPRDVAWTHYYATEETYSRIDYILVSRSMAQTLDRSGTSVLAFQDWGLASDHRPILARFFRKTD